MECTFCSWWLNLIINWLPWLWPLNFSIDLLAIFLVTEPKFKPSWFPHRRPKLTIRGIDQILMIYIRVSSETWPLKVRGVVLHIGRWEFERFTRLCMELKITKDTIARWNKMLLFWNEIKKKYSPCLVSVVHLAYFIVFVGFWGVCRSFLWTESRLDRAVSKDLDREAVFSPKFGSAARFSPPTQRRIVHSSPCIVGLKKRSSFPLQFERFLLHHWSFQLSSAHCDRPFHYGTAWNQH